MTRRAARWLPAGASRPPRDPPPKGLRGAFQRIGGLLLLLVLVFGLILGWDYFDRMRYNQVSARIHAVSTSCVLERPRKTGSDRYRHRTARMSCAEARSRAAVEPVRPVEVKTVDFTYRSPANGHVYRATLHIDAVLLPADVHAGGEMIVYSLRAEPRRVRERFLWPVD